VSLIGGQAMKRGLIAILMSFMSFAPVFLQAQEAPAQTSDLPENFPELRFRFNPTYHSIGLKLGHVLTVRRHRPILSTFEGEMMLGFGTGPADAVDRQCMQVTLEQGTSTRRSNQQEQDELRAKAAQDCFLFTNPWRFSFLNTPTFNLISEIKDRPVVIYYVNYYIAPSHLLMKTKNQVLEAFPTQPNLKLDPSFRIRTWAGVLPEAGVITGRIVQASIEYPVRKTYEVIIQESENANNFRAMSVSDVRLFQYITHAMLTGRLVRIHYVRLYNPHGALMSTLLNYLTNFRVSAVELVENGN
jgi:hypothetical protein